MISYKSWRIIDGKPRWVILDEIGTITNRTPNKCELKRLDKFPEKDGRGNPRHYNSTNTCDRCREQGIIERLVINNALREKDRDGNETGRLICHKCYMKDYNDRPDSHKNIIKSFADCRTGN